MNAMNAMTSRERQIRCFSHQETDRPAIYSRTGYPRNDTTYDRLKDYLAIHSDLRGNYGLSEVRINPRVETDIERIDDDTVKYINVLHTPLGDLQSVSLYKPSSQASYMESYYIKTHEDALRYLSLPMPEYAKNTGNFFKMEREIGDRGIVLVNLGTVPGGRIAELCGSETLAVMSIEDRDILHEICERELKIILDTLDCLLAEGVGPFFSILGEEYITPPLHGPNDFKDFVSRYDKPIIDKIHNAGGRVHMHCHGPIKALLNDFVSLGPDVLHPIEPPPLGDVSAAEAKKAFGGKICVEGNIQIHHMYEHTPEDVAEETLRLIRDAFYDGRGLIVSPTASPYIYGKGETAFPRYKAMTDAVLSVLAFESRSR